MSESTEVIDTRPTIPVLSRLTTVYVPVEDRVRVSGRIGQDRVVVIWLTLRLLNRMIPMLTEWLEKQDTAVPRGDLLQSVKQERAHSQHVEKAREDAGKGENVTVPADAPDDEWLALGLEFKQRDERLYLLFRDQPKDPGHTVALPLQPVQLRQWLNILRAAYRAAEWPVTVWPEWLQEPEAAASMTSSTSLH
ncbi:MAG: hypothetical protein ACQETO_06425 [Pseudomonadota bacterium]